MSQENKDFIRRYLGELSGVEKLSEIVDRYVSEDDPELKQHIMMYDAVFPKYELNIDDMVSEGDKVVVRATFRGTHEGPLGDIPATHKSVSLMAIIIYRIEDGKIVEHWMVIDQMELMKQLGVM